MIGKIVREYSKKPCPGCGSVLALPPNTVCHSCVVAVRDYPKARAALAASDKANLREYLMGERSGIPSTIYQYVSAPLFAGALSGLLRYIGNAVENTEPQGFHNSHRVNYSHHGVLECQHKDIDAQDWRIHLPKDVESHLSLLFEAIREVVAEAKQLGKSEGQNLLFQLNSGDISLNDFNDAAINKRR